MMTTLLSTRISEAAPTDAMTVAMSINKLLMTTPVFLSKVALMYQPHVFIT
jgi:hypothetical protein